MKQPTVAVITSTIGRPDLVYAIESVKAQSYPCKHYVFIDGEQYYAQAQAILKDYPDVIATYLPMNTGANGWVNSAINAIASYLIKEDIVCYLDDDNWYEPNHIASVVEVLEKGADYAYSLRRLVNKERTFLCNDDFSSLGQWRCHFKEPLEIFMFFKGQRLLSMDTVNNNVHHIDTNCFAFPRKLAIKLSESWFTGVGNDRYVYAKLNEMQKKGVCTGLYSVNYYFDLYRIYPKLAEYLRKHFDEKDVQEGLESFLRFICCYNIQMHGGTPWAKEA